MSKITPMKRRYPKSFKDHLADKAFATQKVREGKLTRDEARKIKARANRNIRNQKWS